MPRQGLSANSVLKNHRILSRALRIAMRRGRVGRNVATLVEPGTVTGAAQTPETIKDLPAVFIGKALDQ
jgi:hypothetical protein